MNFVWSRRTLKEIRSLAGFWSTLIHRLKHQNKPAICSASSQLLVFINLGFLDWSLKWQLALEWKHWRKFIQSSNRILFVNYLSWASSLLCPISIKLIADCTNWSQKMTSVQDHVSSNSFTAQQTQDSGRWTKKPYEPLSGHSDYFSSSPDSFKAYEEGWIYCRQGPHLTWKKSISKWVGEPD